MFLLVAIAKSGICASSWKDARTLDNEENFIEPTEILKRNSFADDNKYILVHDSGESVTNASQQLKQEEELQRVLRTNDADDGTCKQCCTVEGWLMIFGAIGVLGPWIIGGLVSILDPSIMGEMVRVFAFISVCSLIVFIGGGIGAAINGVHIQCRS
eukprot:CAMPEP_0183719516 /NCGR_PEP_ID=MMETSP0737-20130205/12417_1 /TAXON_ID=385413 /ORGANISM="Thalassiosira miniscula, Strain CCMP1093" /LENGTH=156 /DNA_ID=CAMNT_0025949235 /DNA_START=321 /DNA_END=791 /DNA_ORIENTATION=-